MPKKLFTSQQLKEIEETVKKAESISGGEIVPVFVKQSSNYEIALWRGGFLSSLIAGIILVILYLLTDLLLFLPPYFWSLIPITFGLIGAWLTFGLPGWRRRLIGRNIMESQVAEKAKAAFYDYNVSLTDQRSGILLLISFFERKAMILADVGIAELVDDEVWRDVVAELTHGIHQGHLTESICEAILKCGNVVSETGLQKGEGGYNELSDTVIIES